MVLTRNELQILACLMQCDGKIISRADLMETLWDSQIYIDDNTLSVNVTRLRAKLAELGMADLIKTRRGMGYNGYDNTVFHSKAKEEADVAVMTAMTVFPLLLI